MKQKILDCLQIKANYLMFKSISKAVSVDENLEIKQTGEFDDSNYLLELKSVRYSKIRQKLSQMSKLCLEVYSS